MLRVPGGRNDVMEQPDMSNVGNLPQNGGFGEPQGGEYIDNNGFPPQDAQQENGSEFDTNFDAGVSADEDADPKKYIQQLTGKLSTKLVSFNGENSDSSLNKYVGKMILRQVVKGLDEKSKKELIGIINTSDNEEPVHGDINDEQQDFNDK